jgi:hypothetical protein
MSSDRSKVALFIDGANLYTTAKALGFGIDYDRLLKEFQSCGRLLRAFFYTTIIEGQENSSIRPVLGGDLVHHFGGGIAKHPLSPDIEDLNDTLRVGGDAREIGAVENRALQGTRLEQRLFRLLARGVIGTNEQIANDGTLRVAQGRD